MSDSTGRDIADWFRFANRAERDAFVAETTGAFSVSVRSAHYLDLRYDLRRAHGWERASLTDPEGVRDRPQKYEWLV
jgi:hypothetical protein